MSAARPIPLPDEMLSPKQARARLGVSRTVFDSRFRPQLTEYRHGPRTVRFSALELSALLAETVAPREEEQDAGMFGRRTVKDALDNAWRAKWRDSKGARKKEQLKAVVEREMGDVKLSAIDYNAIDEWVQKLRDRDLAVATIKSRVSCLYYALGLAVKKGWLKQVPPSPEIGTPERKLRWLTEDEARRLIAACGCQHYVIADVMRDVITFLLDTGARLSELIKTREDDLTERGNRTYVTFTDRKAGDTIMVPLTTAASAAIYRLLANKYWMKRVRGARESAKRRDSAQNWLTHRFAEIRDHAGLPDVTAHTLRHTFASRLAQRGASLYQIQKLLGHSDIRMTDRYAHLVPDGLGDVVSVLEPVDGRVARMDDYRGKNK